MKVLFRIFIGYLALIQVFIFLYFIFFDHPVDTDDSKIAFLEIESKWVDNLMLKLTEEQKAGQLIILSGTFLNQQGVDSLIDLINNEYIGGVIIEDTINAENLCFLEKIRTTSKIPVFLALENKLDMPSLLMLSAANDTSLVNLYSKVLLEKKEKLGFNIELGLFPDSYQQLDNQVNITFGSNRQKATLYSNLILSELKKNKMVACAGKITSINYFSKDSSHIRDSIWWPYKSMAKKGIHFLRTSAEIDISLPNKSLKYNYIKEYLEQNIGFKGLLISEPFLKTHSEKLPIEEALFSGCDLIVLKKNYQEQIDYVKQLVNSKLLTKRELNRKVRNILLAKAWMQLDIKKTLPESATSTSILNSKLSNILNSKAKRQSILLLRNQNNLLPLNPASNSNYLILMPERNDFPSFYHQLTLYKFCTQKKYSIDKKISPEIYKGFGTIILLLNNEIDTIQMKDFYQSLKDLNNKGRLIIVNVKSYKNLKQLAQFKSIIQVFDESQFSQQVMAQVIYGAFSLTGILPFSISKAFPLGTHVSMNSTGRLRFGIPEEEQMNSATLAEIDTLVLSVIKKRIFPGCQVLIVKNSNVVYMKSFGYYTYEKLRKVSDFSIYDLASITKVCATTLATMKLAELDSLSVQDSVKYYLDDTIHCPFKNHRIEEFLLHKSGLQPDMPILKFINYRSSKQPRFGMMYQEKPDSNFSIEVAKDFYLNKIFLDSIWSEITNLKVDTLKPYLYSDINFNVLQKVITKKMKFPLNEYVMNHFYRPLGLQTMGYRPLERFDKEQIIPTAEDKFWRHQLLQGYPHDESAAIYGGVSGNAGLFSNSLDMAVLFQMLLNKGTYGGFRFFKPETIEEFVSPREGFYRGLGFGWNQKYFGHTGFTGTCVWANPETGIIYIILSNRIYPRVKNRNSEKEVREQIMNIISKSVFMN